MSSSQQDGQQDGGTFQKRRVSVFTELVSSQSSVTGLYPV